MSSVIHLLMRTRLSLLVSGSTVVGSTRVPVLISGTTCPPLSPTLTESVCPIAIFVFENGMTDKSGKPFIGVTINYRLSSWGFLTSQEVTDAGVTNLGLRDQRLALQWVQEKELRELQVCPAFIVMGLSALFRMCLDNALRNLNAAVCTTR